ncbi:MAG: AraC family transcriptional regulator [Chitinophagaceae bacterium]
MQLDVRSTANRKIIDFRKMHMGNLCVLGRYHYSTASRELEYHRHPGMIEICYYDKGRQVFSVGEEKYLVTGGDVFIHFPGEEHGSGGHPEEKGSLYWFIIKAEGSKKVAGANKDIGYLVQQLIRNGKRHFKGSAEMKKILEEIFAAMQLKNISKEIVHIQVRLLAQLFLLKVLEKSNEQQDEPQNVRLEKVYRFISDNLSETITVAMLAKEANLSESRFKGWFKEASGFTPLDYVQRCRVQKAVERLQTDPSASVKDLAFELNFSSQQYFTTVIKKFTGKTPGELMKR